MNNKKELLKQLETAMSAYTNMYGAFKNAEMEKEVQMKELSKKIATLKKEIETEDKKAVESVAKNA